MESFIPVPGTGEDLRTIEQTVDGSQRHAEVIVLGDPENVTELARVVDGALLTSTKGAVISQSGSQFFEGIRDDIALIFSRDQGAEAITHLVDVSPTPHSVVHDTTEGRAVFSINATPGAVCYRESDKTALYEPGHMILGGQTIEPSAIPIGDGKIEWGFGEDDGAGDILNAIGMGLDAIGIYAFRIKAGAYVHKVYENSPANSLPVGQSWEYPLLGFDVLKNNIMGPAFEWYGVASPHFYIADGMGRPHLVHISQTAGQITGTTVPEPRLPLFIRIQGDSTVGQALSVSSGCWRGGTLTNKTVLTGQQPDRDYVDLKADGRAFMTETALGAGATYTSSWQNSNGWSSIELFIATDQVSASDGIELQFTDDIDAISPIIRGRERFTYTTSDISAGHLIIRRGSALKGFRVVYANGGTPQGSFFLAATLRVAPAGSPLNSLESDIDISSIAAMMRGALFAKNDSGLYGLITRGDLGGLRTSITEHEANTPIKSDTAAVMTTGTVPTTGDKIVDIAAIPSGATAVQIQSASNNGNAVLYLATTQAGSVGGIGAGAELSAGQAMVFSLGVGTTTDIWGASSTGTVRWRKTWLTGGAA